MLKFGTNQMGKCPACKGEGLGVMNSGTRWVCDCCGGAGKVSKFPPARSLWVGYVPAMSENGWTS